MRPALFVFASTCALTGALMAQEHLAGSNFPCEKNIESTTQLPLVPNSITLHFPRTWFSVTGTWKVKSSDGMVTERSCEKGNKGPCASPHNSDPADPCIAATIDLAMRLGLWKPGTYALEWVAKEGPERLGPIALTIEEPLGSDKDAYETVLLTCLQEQKAHRGGEMMAGTFFCLETTHYQTILDRFPTSTYAGYALVGKGPASSLQAASVASKEVRDQMWNVPTAAPKEQQEARRKEIREKYENFLQMTQDFLKVHPDFAREDMLRKEMAIVYFNLLRPQEAWLEVEALAKLEGPWAEEGRQVLENRKKATQPASEPAPALKKAPEPEQPATRPKEQAN